MKYGVEGWVYMFIFVYAQLFSSSSYASLLQTVRPLARSSI
jgi:hypothetical protein